MKVSKRSFENLMVEYNRLKKAGQLNSKYGQVVAREFRKQHDERKLHRRPLTNLRVVK